MQEAPEEIVVRRRRLAPRYRIFIGAGVLLGVAVAGFLTLAFSNPDEYSVSSVLGYMAVLCGLVGGFAGGLLAVLLDRP